MKIISWGPEDLTYEKDYNTYARRLFPWPSVPEPEWGGAWVLVGKGETLTPHSHDEREIFLVVKGEGVLRHGDEERKVAFGDTIYMTPYVEHCLENTGDEDLLFVSIWWDTGKTTPEMIAAEEGSAAS